MPMAVYDQIITIAETEPKWLAVIKACYEESDAEAPFAGSWVYWRLEQWFPSLKPLARWGIIRYEYSRRSRRRAYYTMPDREQAAKALRDLGVNV